MTPFNAPVAVNPDEEYICDPVCPTICPDGHMTCPGEINHDGCPTEGFCMPPPGIRVYELRI